jgi:hypothetical protein
MESSHAAWAACPAPAAKDKKEDCMKQKANRVEPAGPLGGKPLPEESLSRPPYPASPACPDLRRNDFLNRNIFMGC